MGGGGALSPLPVLDEERAGLDGGARRRDARWALVALLALALGRLLVQAGWAAELVWSETEQVALECSAWSTRGSSYTGCAAPGLSAELLLFSAGGADARWSRAPAVAAAPAVLLLVVAWVAVLGGGLRARLVAAAALLAMPGWFRLHAAASAAAVQAAVLVALVLATTLVLRRLDRLRAGFFVRSALGGSAGIAVGAVGIAFGIDPVLLMASALLAFAAPWRSGWHRGATFVALFASAVLGRWLARSGRSLWSGGALDGADGLLWLEGAVDGRAAVGSPWVALLETGPASALLVAAGLAALWRWRGWRPLVVCSLLFVAVAWWRLPSATHLLAPASLLAAVAAVGAEDRLARRGRTSLALTLGLVGLSGVAALILLAALP